MATPRRLQRLPDPFSSLPVRPPGANPPIVPSRRVVPSRGAPPKPPGFNPPRGGPPPPGAGGSYGGRGGSTRQLVDESASRRNITRPLSKRTKVKAKKKQRLRGR